MGKTVGGSNVRRGTTARSASQVLSAALRSVDFHCHLSESCTWRPVPLSTVHMKDAFPYPLSNLEVFRWDAARIERQPLRAFATLGRLLRGLAYADNIHLHYDVDLQCLELFQDLLLVAQHCKHPIAL